MLIRRERGASFILFVVEQERCIYLALDLRFVLRLSFDALESRTACL